MPSTLERIGDARGAPLYLLPEATADGCERIIWGTPVRDNRWQEPEYLNPDAPWGDVFDPRSTIGSIGFFDVTTRCPAPRDARLDGHLLRMRIGIAHRYRGRGYGTALHGLCERYARDLGMHGVAALNPHEKFGDVFDEYRALTDIARRRWMVKTF